MTLIPCRHCGHQISDLASACPKCGISLVSPESEIQLPCPECENPVSNILDVCSECGFPLGKLREQNKQRFSANDLDEFIFSEPDVPLEDADEGDGSVELTSERMQKLMVDLGLGTPIEFKSDAEREFVRKVRIEIEEAEKKGLTIIDIPPEWP